MHKYIILILGLCIVGTILGVINQPQDDNEPPTK
jgi:hypothetical protein